MIRRYIYHIYYVKKKLIHHFLVSIKEGSGTYNKDEEICMWLYWVENKYDDDWFAKPAILEEQLNSEISAHHRTRIELEALSAEVRNYKIYIWFFVDLS